MSNQEFIDTKKTICQQIVSSYVTRKSGDCEPYWRWRNIDVNIECVNCSYCGNYILSGLQNDLPNNIICVCPNDQDVDDDYDSIDYLLDQLEYWSDF